jgi:hypothetical protein
LTSQIAQSYHINYKTIFIVDKGNELSYVGLLLSLLVRSPERYLHNPLSLLLFLAGSFGRFFPRQGRNFISRAYVYRSSWTSCLTGCLSSFLSVLAKSMNTGHTNTFYHSETAENHRDKPGGRTCSRCIFPRQPRLCRPRHP